MFSAVFVFCRRFSSFRRVRFFPLGSSPPTSSLPSPFSTPEAVSQPGIPSPPAVRLALSPVRGHTGMFQDQR